MTITTRLDPSGWRVRWDPARAERLIESGAWANRTMAELAEELVRRLPDQLVAIDGDKRLTANDLYIAARKLAGSLMARGLKPGQRISYQLPNWHEAIIIDLAATMAGLVVNPLVPIFREAELSFMMGEMESKLIFIPASFRGHDYREMMRRVLASGIKAEVVVIRGNAGDFTAFEDLVAAGDANAPLPDVSPDDVKLALYTSGTTGRAKAVLHTHNTVGAMGDQFRRHMQITDQDVTLVSSPVTHITGAILAFQLPWVVGATGVLMDVWEGNRAVELIRKHKVSVSNGAALFVQDIIAGAQAANDPLPSLRVFIAGGSAIPEALARGAYETLENCVLFRGYGSTECPTTSLGSMRREDMQFNISTDGRPSFTEVKIVDLETEQRVGVDQIGEIRMIGPQAMLGYLRAEDNVSAFDDEGFFRSGDLGRFVVDDWIEVVGRSKDIIIRAGENLSPTEVENALVEHPAIEAIAIVAMPSERTGEMACAFVIPSAGQTPTLPDLADFLIARGYAKQKIPEHLELVSALPMTAAGKVQKQVLRDQAKAIAAGLKA